MILHVFLVVIPLVNGIQEALEQKSQNAKAMLTGPAGLALAIDDQRVLDKLVSELSSAPLIKGVVISNNDNHVIAAAWEGALLEDVEAIERIVQGNLERWQISDGRGNRGNVFVALQDAWPSTLEAEITRAIAFDIVGVLLFALIAAVNIRQSLAIRISALNTATKAIARGAYDSMVSVSGKGPIAELGRNFNKMSTDIGELTRRLADSEKRYSLAVDGSNEAIWDWHKATGRLYLSHRYGDFVGRGNDEIPGLLVAWMQTIHPDDQALVNKSLQDHLDEGKPLHAECRVQHADGSWRWLLLRGKAVQVDEVEAIRVVGSIAEITEQKKIRLALDRERVKAQVTLQSIADAVITIDRSGRLTYLNPAAEVMLNVSRHDVMAQSVLSVLEFISESDTAALKSAIKKTLGRHDAAIDLGQAELILESGERRIVEHNIASLRDKEQQSTGGVIVMHDVTDRFQLLQRLAHQATHDPLTQLVNRSGFEHRMQQTIEQELGESSARHCICYMDLDQFKTVNDTCGHAAGDELLRQVSDVLRNQVRKEDMLARLGGDEFGLLLLSCPIEKAIEIAETILRTIESFRFSWDGKTFSIGLSIGLTPFDVRPGATVASIMSAVDQACFIAKSKGRNRIHLYQPSDEESSRWHKEVHWVPHIHQAMDEDRFVLMAQPIVSLGDYPQDAGAHFEILLRMRSSSGDLISPGSFMPAAERYDLMAKLDRWVVKKALETLSIALLRDSRYENATFGINISGAVLSDNKLLDFVKHFVATYQLPANMICFEITETVAIANFTHAHRFVKELKEVGCQFALDDFGSGFASFSYLKTMPVDYLKIDGSFVRHMVENDIDRTMVDIINQLGHVMKLKTIAEFVENADIKEALRMLGVDYAQGYLFGKPTPLQDVLSGEETVANRFIGT